MKNEKELAQELAEKYNIRSMAEDIQEMVKGEKDGEVLQLQGKERNGDDGRDNDF